ncbi:hypothetical protein [Pedobacter roseus]|uniref:Uncharacterized protein n=1 Tax=Pedobacter roseus TaxID=336820 RepID=A0A7G9QN52_9SPHI|nr:hypothetical protein [Pedobacter roseus]QNN44777.1 hypothetical protein H9L23_12160 [Pedobacter roseus]
MINGYFTSDYFSDLIKKDAGKSVQEYIQLKLMNAACFYLSPDLAVCNLIPVY